MDRITVYSSKCRGARTNCLYETKHIVTSIAELAEAVTYDNVCAYYKENYRNKENFIESDCMPFDCDNDHSENPSEWVTPEDVKNAFPGVCFYVIYSRNHMKWKGNKSPRPRFHVYFPIDTITDAEDYASLKTSVLKFFPYFDTNATDAARFFFGIDEPVVEYFGGEV